MTDKLENAEKMPESNLEEDLLNAVNENDEQQVEEIVSSISRQDALHQVSLMSLEERDHFIAMLTVEEVAELVTEAPPELSKTIFERLDSGVAAQILDKLQPAAQADIVQEINEWSANAILSEMPLEEAEEVRKLSQYEADTAGGLMETDAFTFITTDTVGTVLRKLIKGDDEFERHRGQHPYIVDEDHKLVGVVSLRGMLRSKRSVALADIMSTPMSVQPQTGQKELDELFDANPFLGIPVVDEKQRLVGVVSRESVANAELARVEQEARSRQKVGDELRSMPILLRSKRRLAWLSSNIVLNIIAASVIASYEETLAAVIAIAVFLPMVSDMSGCSGNQAVAVSMRELALGLARPADLYHVLKKELGVGIINGIVLGILIGIVAWVWKGNVYLGLVIGLALSLNTLIAVSIGGTVPLILKRFGVDPAVASGPLLTTVTDMAGFFLVLSLATVFMPQLLS